MNDRDKKAFQEWNNLPVDQILEIEKYRKWIDSEEDTMDFFIEIAWQAGCRHKQKEVDDLAKYILNLKSRLEPFSNYSEIGKIVEEIKAMYEISKQNAK